MQSLHSGADVLKVPITVSPSQVHSTTSTITFNLERETALCHQQIHQHKCTITTGVTSPGLAPHWALHQQQLMAGQALMGRVSEAVLQAPSRSLLPGLNPAQLRSQILSVHATNTMANT